VAENEEGSNPEPDDADLIADLDGPEAFEGVVPEKPAGAPPPREREAKPAPAGTKPASGEPVAPAPGELPDDLKRDLAAEGLPIRAGEPESTARARLTHHLRGKNASMLREAKEARQELKALRAQTEEILRQQWRQANGQQTEEDLRRAAIPDADLDPAGYTAWAMKQLLEEREKERISQAEFEQRKAELEEHQAAVNELDRQAVDAIAYATGARPDGSYGEPADPEAYDAYFWNVTRGYETFAALYPTASHEQIEAMLAAQQQLDMRTLVSQGRDPIEVLKAYARAQSGGRYREEVAAVRAAVAAKKNGGQPPAPKPAPAKNPARRSAVSPSPSARSGAPTREINPATMEEDEFVEAALAGRFDREANTVKNYGRRYGA
jgi:hypothetical protein